MIQVIINHSCEYGSVLVPEKGDRGLDRTIFRLFRHKLNTSIIDNHASFVILIG